MKALIDTCVVMDFLQQREPFAGDAKALFRATACEQFIGSITAKSATDIYYLVHRCTHSDKEARNKLNSLLSIVNLLDTAAVDVYQALTSETSDFEDAVMIETAARNNVDCIITRNPKDYKKSGIVIFSPSEFLRHLTPVDSF